MPNGKSPGVIHAKILAALDKVAAMPAGFRQVQLPISIVMDAAPAPGPTAVPGIQPTLVTWPDGQTRVQGSVSPGPDAVPGGVFRWHITLALTPGAAAKADMSGFVQSLAAAPGVVSLEPVPGVRPDLYYSIPEIEARRNPPDDATDVPGDGTGMIVGVVDFGLDFAHPNFTELSGSTVVSRVLAIWDQNEYAADFYPPTSDYKPVTSVNPALWYSEASANTLYSKSRVYLRDLVTRNKAGFGAGQPPYINNKVDNANPYTNYYDPHKNYYLLDVAEEDVIAHGTHVTDIAAGNGRAEDCHPGVAPKADIVFVQVRRADLADWTINPADVLNAVYFIFILAKKLEKPAVVNVSMNFYSGLHDGTGPYDKTLSDLVHDDTIGGKKHPKMVVVSAGNSYGAGQHARLVLNGATEESFQWAMPRGDMTTNYLTVWYNSVDAASDKMEVTVRSSKFINSGSVTQAAATGAVAIKDSANANTIGTITARQNFGTKWAIHVNMGQIPAVQGEADKAFLEVGLKWNDATSTVKRAHAWIERDDLTGAGQWQSTIGGADRGNRQKRFDQRQTLGDFACGANVIAVGAINTPTDLGPGEGGERALLDASASGPPVDFSTLDKVVAANAPDDAGLSASQQPWLVAPGVAVAAARSKGGRRTRSGGPILPLSTVMSGTSMAAPHVAGAVAVLLQKSMGLVTPKTGLEIKNALRDGVYNAPATATYDERLGFGRLNLKAAWNKVV